MRFQKWWGRSDKSCDETNGIRHHDRFNEASFFSSKLKKSKNPIRQFFAKLKWSKSWYKKVYKNENF